MKNKKLLKIVTIIMFLSSLFSAVLSIFILMICLFKSVEIPWSLMFTNLYISATSGYSFISLKGKMNDE